MANLKFTSEEVQLAKDLMEVLENYYHYDIVDGEYTLNDALKDIVDNPQDVIRKLVDLIVEIG